MTTWKARALAAEAKLAEIQRLADEEAAEDAKWAAIYRQNDVRCIDCQLRYGERDQYSCVEPGTRHQYSERELEEALEPIKE